MLYVLHVFHSSSNRNITKQNNANTNTVASRTCRHRKHRRTENHTIRCYYAPSQGALSDDTVWRLSVCLTSVAYIRPAGGVCGRPAGWGVLADGARLGRPGQGCRCALPLQAWAGAYRGGRPPTACSNCNIMCLKNVSCRGEMRGNGVTVSHFQLFFLKFYLLHTVTFYMLSHISGMIIQCKLRKQPTCIYFDQLFLSSYFSAYFCVFTFCPFRGVLPQCAFPAWGEAPCISRFDLYDPGIPTYFSMSYECAPAIGHDQLPTCCWPFMPRGHLRTAM